MNLTGWAHARGIRVTTAYRWYREGAARPGAEGWPADPGVPGTAAGSSPLGGAGLYGRVSCRAQKAGLDRQVARLPVRAAQAGLPVVRVEAWVGSGMNGIRARARRLLAGPAASVVVVEHRGRLGRVNTGLAEAALATYGRRLVVVDDSEVADDLVRDMIGVLTWFCARRCGRRPARDRALKAVGCARRDIGPQAVLKAGSTPGGGAG